mgnify:CR=1 FL=1
MDALAPVLFPSSAHPPRFSGPLSDGHQGLVCKKNRDRLQWGDSRFTVSAKPWEIWR